MTCHLHEAWGWIYSCRWSTELVRETEVGEVSRGCRKSRLRCALLANQIILMSVVINFFWNPAASKDVHSTIRFMSAAVIYSVI